jgi:hypothetical protein
MTRYRFSVATGLLVVFLMLPAASVVGAADIQHERYQQALRQQPEVLRYYDFAGLAPGSLAAPNLAGAEAPLTYVEAEPLRLVEGARPGTQAVRLDRGYLQGEPFEVGEEGITLAIRFRKHGQGAHLGNDRPNGMLFAVGNGYWEGLRVWTPNPAGTLHFEIGRPQPQNAFGLSTAEPATDGTWHHLAATWDRRQMRLYLNGILLRAADFEGDYTPPAGAFRVGYAGAGIGSLVMDVDEVAVFRGALAADEILAQAFFRGRVPEPVRGPYRQATEASALGDWPAAEAAFTAISEDDRIPPGYRAVAQIGRGRALRQQNQPQAALAEFAQVAADAQVPEPLRMAAARMTLHYERGVAGAAAPREVYERLLEEEGLTGNDRLAAMLGLAERLLNEGQAEEARRVFDEILESEVFSGSDAWSLRLQGAHAYLSAGDHAAAREAYDALAEAAEAPPEVRGIARLTAAHSHFLENDYSAAAAAFAGVAEDEGLLPHHRWEAGERRDEVERLAQGEPARDPGASRTRVRELPEPGATFFVAPDGDDSAAGTEAAPFATLARARDAVRALRREGSLPPGGVRVFVRGGLYRAEETFALSEEDSGTEAAPIVYRAYPGETPRFHGGVELSGFQPVTDEAVLARLPEAARDHVVMVDLTAAGIDEFGSLGLRGFGLSGANAHPWVDLYVDGQPMELARWPNEGFVQTGAVHRGGMGTDQAGQPGEFDYPTDRPERWNQADDAWMFGYWGHLWAGRTVRIAEIDLERGRFATEHGTSYGFREGMPFYVFNVLEELERPGEWFLDRTTGILYLYPPRDLDEAVVELPLLADPFVRMENVRHVTLRGLVFELGRSGGAVIQGGSDVLLAGCTFRCLGTNAVVVNGGRRHGVLGCDLYTLGAGGVVMAGGDRATLTPGEHFVENTLVRDFTRIDRVYAPAIHLDGVGNRIAHNLFHDSPHHGMRVEGFEHTIELNEIHSVVYESDDQSGIDMFGNPAYRGNVIRYNFWHHVGSGHSVAGQAGIRLDDFISATLMYSNVFYRAAGGQFGAIQIHGGKDNIADNNLFIDCQYAVSFSPWGEKRWREGLASDWIRRAISAGGVDISQPPFSDRYPDLARMEEDANRNFLWRNVAVDCGRFAVRDPDRNEFLDNLLLGEDPGFADPAGRDFSLPADAPLFRRLGFRPIPFDEIGLYEDEHRASWPVRHEITPHYIPAR